MNRERVYAIANQKGGVGKTTTAINLAASLCALGDRVLLVDMDAQGNATMGSGVDKNLVPLTVYDSLVGEAEHQRVLVKQTGGGYDLLPANSDMTGLDVVLRDLDDPHGRLQSMLGEIEDYDYVLIDCPPALSLATLNCLVASCGVLIPVQCEYYALEGLSDLINTMQQASESLGIELRVEGLLRTMYDGRSLLCQDVSNQLVEHFGDKLYDTVIPRNVRLAEAPSYGLPTLAYSPESKGAQTYREFAAEFRNRVTANV